MIVRQGGGNSGIAEYLEKGAKFDRHYSRDELDTRIIIDGDLQVTDTIINSIPNRDQERYLHITLSFNEPGVTSEKMQAVYEDYKARLLSAYQPGELNTYAEIHWPKTQQLLDKSTGEMYDRYPHIHMVIPKQNLLSGKYANPTGLYERNINIWEALQEDVNNTHGLKSPAHSPRISIENYKAVLDRHKVAQFKTSTGQLKKEIYSAVESGNVRSWKEYQELVSRFGDVKVRNAGTEWEYLAVKTPGNKKFTNLVNPIFSKMYVETRDLPREPLTQYQINNRLAQWEKISRELKYIEDAGPAIKKQYRALDDVGQGRYLKLKEEQFYGKFEIPEPKRKARAFRPGYSQFKREFASDKRSMYDMPPRHLVHEGDSGIARRVGMLLPDDSNDKLQLVETVGATGLHGAVYSETGERVISSREQIKSVASQIIFNVEELQAIDKASELEQFKEIRLKLKAEVVLAYAQAHYLIDPADHKCSKAKDGSARIGFGVNNYNVSDFFTKGLGLEWRETKGILISLYESQLNKKYAAPVSNDIIKTVLAQFEENEYSLKIDRHKLEMDALKKRERAAFKELNEQYRYNVKAIYAGSLDYTERNKQRALEAFFKLVLEEELKASIYAERERINQLKYPFSVHFKDHLTKERVIDMSFIDGLKAKYGHGAAEEVEENGFANGQPFEMLTGREASRRAKLMAQLQDQGKPYTKYGYSFKDLKPEQKKESVVFYHDSEKLFEARADKVLVSGELDPDKTATALVYSLQRFGNPLDVTGKPDFKEQVIDVAARSGLDIKFTDPVLNDALARRIAELGLEGTEQVNAISAESLELDQRVDEAAAVDKALRESKEREIAADLESMNVTLKDLAVVSIMQRRNAHQFEGVTTETAELDAALYRELATTPAMQAYFATDIANLAQGHDEYRQAIADAGIGSDVMLASHAAESYSNELEAAFGQEPAPVVAAAELESADDPFADPQEQSQEPAPVVAAAELESADDPFADPQEQNQEPSPVVASVELANADDPFADAQEQSQEPAPVPQSWRGPACVVFDEEMAASSGVVGYSRAQQLASTLATYEEMSFEPSEQELAMLEENKEAIEEATSWINENVLLNPVVKARMYETVRDLGRETGDPVDDQERRAYLAEMQATLKADLQPTKTAPAMPNFTHNGEPAVLDLSRFQQQEPQPGAQEPEVPQATAPAMPNFTHNGEPAVLDLSRFQQQEPQPGAQEPEVPQATAPAMPNFTHNGEPAVLDLSRFQQQEPQPGAQEPEAPQATAPAMPNFTHNGEPAVLDLSRFQQQPSRFETQDPSLYSREQVVAKLEQLQQQAAEMDQPQWASFNQEETHKELDRMAESFVRLESIPEGVQRDSAADRLARGHLMAYTDYQGTPYEQEIAEIIADGMSRDDRYRYTIEAESSDGVELAIVAADHGRDLRIIEKENRKAFDMDIAGSGPATDVKALFNLKPSSPLTMDNLSAKNAANQLESIKQPGSNVERTETAKAIVNKLDQIRNSEAESGKAELRRAAVAVAALCASDPALESEIIQMAPTESAPYIAAIIDQGSEAMAMEQNQSSPNMEM